MSRRIGLVLVLAAIAAGVLFLRGRAKPRELALEPGPAHGGLGGPASAATEVGVGWAANENAAAAAREALPRALSGLRRRPNTLFVFVTSASALGAAVTELRKQLGGEVRIYGGTSDAKGVLTHKGLLRQADGGPPVISVMAIASEEIAIGVGSALFEAHPSITEAARAAVLDAVKSAGRPGGEKPRALLLATTPTGSAQNELIAGLEKVVGRETPVLGGQAASVIAGEANAGEGLSVAAVYTDLPVGTTFEGGYDVSSSRSGVITRVEDGVRLVEIDGRPALDVYDEWLEGGMRRLYKEQPKAVADETLALTPLYTRHRSPKGEVYSIFAHVWPSDDALQSKSLNIGTRMQEGERLHLANGTWETLLNRIANLPRVARRRGDLEATTPIVGFGYVCSGVFSVIPLQERPKAPLLMGENHGAAPFIAPVSWGEYGYLPGVGNKYGNLLTSFLVIGPRTAAETTRN
jgi:hypothetical protein